MPNANAQRRWAAPGRATMDVGKSCTIAGRGNPGNPG